MDITTIILIYLLGVSIFLNIGYYVEQKVSKSVFITSLFSWIAICVVVGIVAYLDFRDYIKGK